jgi:hypothetical protein
MSRVEPEEIELLETDAEYCLSAKLKHIWYTHRRRIPKTKQMLTNRNRGTSSKRNKKISSQNT